MTTKTFNYKLCLGIVALVIMSAGCFSAWAGNHQFKSSSSLSSGTWVKVGVTATGIYEISYDELNEMGFADPSSVGVFGKGATMMPISFTDGNTSLVADDLNPVSTWHNDGKLYFYGCGPVEIGLNHSSALFEKKSRNIYADEGVYFLSDSSDAILISPEKKSGIKAIAFPLGYDYEFHENDLYQNSKRTGQLFWGEDLKSVGEVKESYEIPLIDNNSKVYLDCRVYVADKSQGTMRYGVTEALSGNRSFNVVHPAPAVGSSVNPEFQHMANPVLSLSIPGDRAEVYVTVDNPVGDFLNLDYWMLTYGKKTPDFSLSSASQERFSIIRKTARAGVFSIPSGQNVEVFDVSDPKAVKLLPKEEAGNNTSYYFSASRQVHDFVFCNLAKPQLSISYWERVKNTDNHALAAQGADFLIITVPEYQDFAERLAELHRRYDGIEVIVALAPELYNEFSGGVPDPMAYRAMTKMTYEASEGRLKNVLLTGPMLGDFRKTALTGDKDNYIIAFQDLKVSAETDASMVMDFYGFADDYLYTSLQNNVMHVGVGILPLYSRIEADNYLRKVERYMADDDKASFLNEFLSIGGVGDSHTHDSQGVLLAEQWDIYAPDRQINTTLPLDAFGEKMAKKRLMKELHEGKLLTSYFGHGDYRGPNSVYDFFRVTDLKNLRNDKSGFLLIMGCDLSDTDHLRKGFGEAIVTDSEYGMLGCLMSIRTSWSGQNFELAKLFSSALFASSEKVYDAEQPNVVRTKYRDISPTIGEVYARAKTQSNYSNSLTYNYIGDPALVIPVALRRVDCQAPSKAMRGEILKLKGNVWSSDTIHLRDTLPISEYSLPADTEFNGKIVAKVLLRDQTLLSNDYISNTKADGKELYYIEKGECLAEYRGVVKNGKYELDVVVPEHHGITPGDKVQVVLAAYDHGRKLGATGCVDIEMEEIPSSTSEVDNLAPNISLSYEPSSFRVVVYLSDNVGLNASAIEAYVDGRQLTAAPTRCSDDMREIEMAASTAVFGEGLHSVRVVATDQAGNVSEENMEFEISGAGPTMALTTDRKAVKDEILFSLDNEEGGVWEMEITDNNGEEIMRRSFSGTEFIWDCLGSSGRRVAPGLYHAVVRSADTTQSERYTARVAFAVIE